MRRLLRSLPGAMSQMDEPFGCGEPIAVCPENQEWLPTVNLLLGCLLEFVHKSIRFGPCSITGQLPQFSASKTRGT